MNELPEVNKPLRALIASLDNLGALVAYVDGLKSAINDEPALRARVAELHEQVQSETAKLSTATDLLQAVENDLAVAKAAHAHDLQRMSDADADVRSSEISKHRAVAARHEDALAQLSHDRDEIARLMSIEKTALAALLKEQDVVKARISKMKSSVLDALNGV